jgi:hypothetical protein
MSQIVNYIKALPDLSFEAVKEHFISKGCRVHDSGPNYMIVAPVEYNQDLSQAVGTILDKESHNIVCYGFPKTIELPLESIEAPFSGKILASEYIDGSLIRAYYDGSIWRLSTNGVINAYESYWISQKSFGDLFDDCLSRIYNDKTIFSTSPLVDHMNKDYSYQFILRHPSVHLDQTTKAFLYHVGTFNNSNLTYVPDTIDNHFRKPQTTLFNSLDEVQNSIKTKAGCHGYIIYSQENGDTQTPRYKMLNADYSYLRGLIGNTPNLYLRYLECLAEGRADELLDKFPSIRYHSTWVDKCLTNITNDVFHAYVDKFMKKNKEMYVNYYLRPLIYELHGTFMKTQVKVTPKIVMDTFKAYHPKRINFILNGLGMIKTGDVTLPAVDENHVPVAKQDKPIE